MKAKLSYMHAIVYVHMDGIVYVLNKQERDERARIKMNKIAMMSNVNMFNLD